MSCRSEGLIMGIMSQCPGCKHTVEVYKNGHRVPHDARTGRRITGSLRNGPRPGACHYPTLTGADFVRDEKTGGWVMVPANNPPADGAAGVMPAGWEQSRAPEVGGVSVVGLALGFGVSVLAAYLGARWALKGGRR